MTKKILAISLALVIALFAFAACGSKTASDEGGTAKATLVLVLEDKTEVTYDLEVKAGSTVREALYEAKLIDETTYSSYFVETIDGHTALSADGVLWNLCDAEGNGLSKTVDDVTVSDGDTIYMVYTVAPNFDD